MRIVYVSSEFPPQTGGGIGTYVEAISRTLADRGHDVTVVTISDDTVPVRERIHGVTVIRVPYTKSLAEGAVYTLRTWQSQSDAFADMLRKLVRAGRVDVIEFCDYRGEGVTYLATTTPSERPVCVVRLHTPLSVLFKYNTGHTRSTLLEEYERQAMLATDRIVSPSKALAREINAQLGDNVRIDLSPHPVDPMFLRDGPDSQTSDGKDIRNDILYVGRFEERKGVETLAAAAPRVLDACPDARLVMVGGDTEKSARQTSMKTLVNKAIGRAYQDRLDLIDRVPREELVGRYRAARFCVFPSHFENFPNTCLEAMAVGACVIGTDNSGMAEIIEDGASGVIVESADADRLADAMIRLYNAPAEDRRAMGRAAQARIRENYHPDVIAADIEGLYADYIKTQPYRPAPAIKSVSKQPTVAIVVPCYNHGQFLPETLESVRNQTYPNVECVVVDDGSTDPATLDALRQAESQGVRVIRQENSGLAAARNAGVRKTDSPFFVPLDADDRIAPDFVAKLLPALLEDASLGYSYSHVTYFGSADGTWACPEYDPRRLLVENLCVATAVVRRAAFDEAGGYQTDMSHGFEDWDFWLALLVSGFRGRCTPEPLFNYRKHAGGSMLSETQKHRRDMVQTMIGHHRALFG
ncbi:MAG: glycosyltransferase, partial [Planctomycetota bacterium]|nr:glycosyltransferase [Planctomycetota bacterium]